VVRAVVGPVPVVTLPVVVVVLLVVVALVMTGRIVRSVLGDGGSGAADGERKGHGESYGYACGQFHLCLLMDGFRSWLDAPGPREIRCTGTRRLRFSGQR
jgi:hypothetical protein